MVFTGILFTFIDICNDYQKSKYKRLIHFASRFFAFKFTVENTRVKRLQLVPVIAFTILKFNKNQKPISVCLILVLPVWNLEYVVLKHLKLCFPDYTSQKEMIALFELALNSNQIIHFYGVGFSYFLLYYPIIMLRDVTSRKFNVGVNTNRLALTDKS